jgi:hypothetical protein
MMQLVAGLNHVHFSYELSVGSRAWLHVHDSESIRPPVIVRI